jgi:hypothetical protein
MIRLKAILTENAVMNLDDANTLAQQLNSQLSAPYVKAQVSTLGGAERPSVMLSISLDPKSEWKNGIYENSRYARFHIHYDGVIERFSGYGTPKFRKSRFTKTDDVIKKINAYIQEASK